MPTPIVAPTGYSLWVKKLGQCHLARPNAATTSCGMPMLGNNYPKHPEMKKCPECWKYAGIKDDASAMNIRKVRKALMSIGNAAHKIEGWSECAQDELHEDAEHILKDYMLEIRKQLVLLTKAVEDPSLQ